MMSWGTISESETQRIEQLAEEAERIAGHLPIDEFHVAQHIAESTTEKYGPLYWALPVQEGRWKFYRMIGNIWTAGYIAGIREERKRHKLKGFAKDLG